MLTLVTLTWYVCGGAFLLYVLLCAVLITLYEKAVHRRANELFECMMCLEHLFANGSKIAENDLDALSDAFIKACKEKRDTQSSFDFYCQKELFENAASEYNEAVKKYNELVTGYPSCVIAKVVGKEPAAIFTCE